MNSDFKFKAGWNGSICSRQIMTTLVLANAHFKCWHDFFYSGHQNEIGTKVVAN